MLQWSSPIWLLGMGLLPLVWWLHRFRGTERVRAVSALFLWEAAADAATPGARRREPDPVWRLRAVILALMCLAAAGPYWSTPVREVAVWFDDSLSMWTREDGAPRHVLAIRLLSEALEKESRGDVAVHSLAAPGRSLRLESDARGQWQQRIAAWLRPVTTEPLLPAPHLLQESREHWLVTDAALPALETWLKAAPVTRVLSVGQNTENVAFERLALRPSLRAADKATGLLAVTNHGRRPAERLVQLQLGERVLLRRDVALAANETRYLDFELDEHPAGAISARLLPSDALPFDDELHIDRYPPPKARVAVRGNCGRYLRAALEAHPALQLVDASESSALSVICGTQALATPTHAALRFRAFEATRPITEEPVWLPGAGALQELTLPAEGLLIAGDPPEPLTKHSPTALPLLSAGAVPLIVEDAERRIVDVHVDAEAPALARASAYPALVAGLVERLIGQPLLDGIVGTGRSPFASQIAPRVLESGPARTAPRRADRRVALGSHLVGAACLLLLYDLLRLRSGRFRLRRD